MAMGGRYFPLYKFIPCAGRRTRHSPVQMEESEVLVRFFRAIGAEREAEMYFRLFKKTEPGRFAPSRSRRT